MSHRGYQAWEALWLAAAFLLPLAVNPWGCNPFEAPKAALLTALTLGGGLLLFVFAAKPDPCADRPQGSGYAALPLLLALAYALTLVAATLHADNPRLSLWGSAERRQGLVVMLGYLFLFLLVAARLRTHVQARRLLLVIVLGSVPIVVYGLLQASGIDPLSWQSDAESPLVTTLGRANFTATYLLLVIPLTAVLALTRRPWPWLILLALQIACLVLTRSRAAWLGLGAEILLFAVIGAIAHGRRTPRRIAVSGQP